MRGSLRLRLLGLSLAVASLAVVATALLATYGTGSQLRDEAENSASLLETDSYIRGAVLAYAKDHRGWDGIEPLIRDLARQTGRRIQLTTPDGGEIVDSAKLLGERSGDSPAIPAALIDATAASQPFDLVPSSVAPGTADGGPSLSYYGWQLTDQEKRQRDALTEAATACLRREGIDATVYNGGRLLVMTGNGPFATMTGTVSTSTAGLSGTLRTHPCVPEELYRPSAAARALNERAIRAATACLDDHGLAYEVSVDNYGLGEVHSVGGVEVPPRWTQCREDARVEAIRPYVAPPAELYLGTSGRFDPFSPEGWRRTAATAGGVLAVAATVTVLSGRRLVRPVLALTNAARRMESGDHAARVPTTGRDEMTRLATAFNSMADSIETGNRQRKSLVSDVAHELRSPLANVRSLIEAAQDGLVPLDVAFLDSLLEESALLERLVADLQDLALADAGMLRVHPEERDAADLAMQAAAAHRARAEAAGVTVRVDAPDPVPVYADPARLRQALGNLVANAVTHSLPGGTVDAVVRSNDGWAVLTVTDEGPGIAAEHLTHVFDRFYRADPSRSRITGGSGLGLAITKHLVEAHHGTVDAASTPGSGSVFTIRLPQPSPIGDATVPCSRDSGNPTASYAPPAKKAPDGADKGTAKT